jgi:hypothetical protein
MVAARLHDLHAEWLLAVQRITGQHAPLLVNLPDRIRSHSQFGFVLLVIDHQLRQHATEVVTEGTHGVERMGGRGAVA